MMMNLSGDSKANIDKILEEFRNAKMVKTVISIIILFFITIMINIIFIVMIIIKKLKSKF